MRIDLKKLHQAHVVARCGSISLAAEELCMTQPSLSRSIATLESQWDVKIFERGRTGIVVTPIGRELLEESAELLRGAKTLDHNMKLRSRGQAGSIAFGLAPLAGAALMAHLLVFLCNEYPDLQVNGAIKSPDELLDDVRNDRAEFAIYCKPSLPEVDGLSFQLLSAMPLSLVVRADHPLAQNSTVRWRHLKQYPLISTTFKSEFQMPWEQHNIFCDNHHIAREVMLDSDAVWLTSQWLVQNELTEGRASELPLSLGKGGKTSIYIATAKNRSPTPAATVVIEKLKELLASLAG